jgi:hypothetical protein
VKVEFGREKEKKRLRKGLSECKYKQRKQEVKEKRGNRTAIERDTFQRVK